MKTVKSLLLALILLLIFALPIAAHTAAADQYLYTIRIFAGVQGRFTDGSDVLVLQRAYGEHFSFNNSSVVLPEGSKYYVKGIREAGKDNSTVSMSAPEVTRDQDYVVAYGVLGDPVAYTVYYRDRAGNELAPSDTYYGNVGDRPVIAFRYIESYQPQAYNLTKVLTANEADNVFEFVYRLRFVPTTPSPGAGGSNATATPEATLAPTPEPTEATAETATPAPDETATPAPADTATSEPTEAPAITATPEVTEAPAATQAAIETEIPATTEAPIATAAPEASEATSAPTATEEPDEPVELIDLDNPDVPLAPGGNNEQGQSQGANGGSCNTPLLIGGGAGAAVLLGGVIWILAAAAKKKKH